MQCNDGRQGNNREYSKICEVKRDKQAFGDRYKPVDYRVASCRI